VLARTMLKEYLRILVSSFFDIPGFCREKISLLESFVLRNIFSPEQIQLMIKSL
jgi:hypothetical protein